MASLYKRATKEQEQMLRIVAGAVRNAQQAHGLPIDYRFARSVAKRAVGTLSAFKSQVTPIPEMPGALAPSAEGGQDW